MRAWTLATLLVSGGTLLSCMLHALQDGRVPRDLGLTWKHVPALYRAFLGEAPVSSLAGALLEMGGWLEVLAAGWMALLGPDPVLFRLLDLPWLAALLGVAVAAGRSLGGPRAGLVVASLLGAFPMIVVQARLGWIHLPEAALCLGAWLAWSRPEARAPLLTGLLGGLALALRPSAVIWLGPLLLLRLRQRPPVRQLAIVAGGWLLGAMPSLGHIGRYLGSKWEARDRYIADVPGLDAQLPQLLGVPALLLTALGLGMLGWQLYRHGAKEQRAILGLLATWALAPMLLFLLFRAGLDNFTTGFVALALLAARGLVGLPGAPVLALAAWLITTLLPWLPPPEAGSGPERLGNALRLPLRPRLGNHLRIFDGWTAGEVERLVEASCTSLPCRVGADQGLFQPYGEEAGQLGLFLLEAEPSIALVDLRGGLPPGLSTLDALVHYDCTGQDDAWRQRFPRSLEAWQQLVHKLEMEVAWSRRIDPDCTVYWLTPGGALLRPERLPPGERDPRIPHMPTDPAPTEEAERERRRVRPGGHRRVQEGQP